MKHRDIRVGMAVDFKPWGYAGIVAQVDRSWLQRWRNRRRGSGSVLLVWPRNLNALACDASQLRACRDVEGARALEKEYREWQAERKRRGKWTYADDGTGPTLKAMNP